MQNLDLWTSYLIWRQPIWEWTHNSKPTRFEWSLLEISAYSIWNRIYNWKICLRHYLLWRFKLKMFGGYTVHSGYKHVRWSIFRFTIWWYFRTFILRAFRDRKLQHNAVTLRIDIHNLILHRLEFRCLCIKLSLLLRTLTYSDVNRFILGILGSRNIRGGSIWNRLFEIVISYSYCWYWVKFHFFALIYLLRYNKD